MRLQIRRDDQRWKGIAHLRTVRRIMRPGSGRIVTHFIDGKKEKISEGILNRIEAGIRCYDPCLSCSMHALGRMAMHLEVLGSQGEVITTLTR